MCDQSSDPTQHDLPRVADSDNDLAWLDRIVDEQRAAMARWGYSPEMVEAAALGDPGEQGEIEMGWPS
jgi:hypothetical protein